MLPPINFQKWISERRHLLRPPVGNQVVYNDSQYIIMAVGGPNERTDFHINEGEEFFYQIEGDMVLRVRDRGRFEDIPIRAGEMFLLPALMPHSPQRSAKNKNL